MVCQGFIIGLWNGWVARKADPQLSPVEERLALYPIHETKAQHHSHAWVMSVEAFQLEELGQSDIQASPQSRDEWMGITEDHLADCVVCTALVTDLVQGTGEPHVLDLESVGITKVDGVVARLHSNLLRSQFQDVLVLRVPLANHSEWDQAVSQF